jgi:hypothetical protein
VFVVCFTCMCGVRVDSLGRESSADLVREGEVAALQDHRREGAIEHEDEFGQNDAGTVERLEATRQLHSCLT